MVQAHSTPFGYYLRVHTRTFELIFGRLHFVSLWSRLPVDDVYVGAHTHPPVHARTYLISISLNVDGRVLSAAIGLIWYHMRDYWVLHMTDYDRCVSFPIH